jgi:arylsulfatase A-like enzyme
VTRSHERAKPNILVLWGDDIGQFNISAYNMGMMGYKTPNIDSIAQGGALCTDWYGQQSCTAGRAAFITGQSPIRTGLTKVGLPGAPEGMQKEDPTIATLLKAQGYVTGQFGKNHLGDRDEMLRSKRQRSKSTGQGCHCRNPLSRASSAKLTSRLKGGLAEGSNAPLPDRKA